MDASSLRIALLGVGTIGRELIRCTLDNPVYSYIAVGDTSGVIVNEDAFSKNDMTNIVRHKETGGWLIEYAGGYDYYKNIVDVFGYCNIDVLIDVTDAQTFDVLLEALGYAHVVVSNKRPLADVPYSKFRRLVSKSREEERILDFGTTVGAGMRLPNMIKTIGPERIEFVTGCLSGTMNYVSQRINEGHPLSMAIEEASKPPRCYTEPDPRVDLGGEDFARKLVIIGRMCVKGVERSMVNVEDLVPDELKALSLVEFLEALSSLDPYIQRRIKKANRENKTIWYLGNANLRSDEYRIGFEEVPQGDPITRARESENVLKIFPSLWRGPATIIGPGAGATETVTGLISGLSSIMDTTR